MKCTCCSSKMKQLLTSFYCPSCSIKSKKNIPLPAYKDMDWEYTGVVKTIHYGSTRIIITYINTTNVRDDIDTFKDDVEGIDKDLIRHQEIFNNDNTLLYKHCVSESLYRVVRI